MELTEYNDHSFGFLIDEFLDRLFQIHPGDATYLGIHKYDNELDHVDMTTLREFLKEEEQLINVMKEFRERGQLSRDRLLDLEVLLGSLRKDIITDQYFSRYANDPSLYIEMAISACHIMLVRDFAPKEERYLSLAKRLKEIPRFLMEAKENLRRSEAIPAIWLDMARQMLLSSRQFLSDIILNVSGEIELLKNDLYASAILASKSFDDFHKFLETELSAKPEGEFAAGKKCFELLLKEYHMLPYACDELEAIGLKYIDDTIELIREVSKEIDFRKEWMQIIDEVKMDTPSPQELLDYYRREVALTKRFVLENDLVSIPDNESLEVIETPLLHRATLPYAAYMTVPPFEKDQRGYFWVTPIDEQMTAESAREHLSGHSKAAIAVRALHEGYPGHHLQFCHANRVMSKVRRIFGTSVFAEGWALHCEELMKEKGYYSDARTRLIQLKDQLWRACRVVIDVRLHTGRLTFDDAVTMLFETARVERVSAVAEVKRYSQTPTQPMSYLIGKIEIEQLAMDYEGQHPETSLKDFHDQLLSFGTIPIALVRQSMLGTN